MVGKAPPWRVSNEHIDQEQLQTFGSYHDGRHIPGYDYGIKRRREKRIQKQIDLEQLLDSKFLLCAQGLFSIRIPHEQSALLLAFYSFLLGGFRPLLVLESSSSLADRVKTLRSVEAWVSEPAAPNPR